MVKTMVNHRVLTHFPEIWVNHGEFMAKIFG